jgi:hypothetical protein
MSPPPTSPSHALERLRADGYCVEIRENHLLVHEIPYVTLDRKVATGTLVSTLELAGDLPVANPYHVAMFVGQQPCAADGQPLQQIVHQVGRQELTPGVVVDFSFSHKPIERAGYTDYYEKMTTYANLLSGPAQQLEPSATARTYRVVSSDEAGGPFLFMDTAYYRGGAARANASLAGARVAIVGAGGTGSYVLDLLAKTHVAEIHVYDDDRYLQHNAFRAPGSTSIDELEGGPMKVVLHERRWAAMRIGVTGHPYRVDETNVGELDGMDCVFVCVDSDPVRASLVRHLEARGLTFVDTGMGLITVADGQQVQGQVRVTTSTPGTRGPARRHLPDEGAADGQPDDAYRTNIQMVELNALSAALAVVRWKKLRGFYADTESETTSIYTVDGNVIINDRPVDRA